MQIILKNIDLQLIGGLAFLSIIFCSLVIFLYRRRNFLAFLLLGYFLVCSCLLLANQFKAFLPLPSDSVDRFIPAGLRLSTNLHRDILGGLVSFGDILERTTAYTFPLGLVFFFFGDSMIAGGALSMAFGALTIVQMYRLTQTLYDTRTAKFAALLLSISPYYWLLSVLILRDTMVLFFIVWFFRLWMSYENKSDHQTIGWMVFSLLYIGLLRPVALTAILMVIAIYHILIVKKSKHPWILKYLVVGVFGLALVYGIAQYNVLVYAQAMGGSVGKGAKYLDLDNASERAQASGSSASSNYNQGLEYHSFTEALTVLPMLVFYFMCSPLPWQIGKFNQLLALADSMVLWTIYLFFALEIKAFYKRDPKWATILILYLGIGILGSSLIQGNIGAAERHRVMFTVFILPIAAHNLLSRWQRKK
jgi:hypothetical protein